MVPGLLYAEVWQNARDGEWKTSIYDMLKRFPYLSENVIRVSLSILLSEGLLFIEGVEADSHPFTKERLSVRCRRYK